MKTELLSLLSPKAIDLLNPGGGWAKLTPQDIAAALSGLKGGPYYLGLCVYVADSTAFYALYSEVAGIKGIPKKPADLKGFQPIESILLLCLDELWGNNKCKGCGGTGLTMNEFEQLVSCEACRCKDQEGKIYQRKLKAYTDLSRSRQARIPYHHWPKYRGFYERLFMQLTDWDARIRSHLATRLSNEQFDSLPKVPTSRVHSENDAARQK